MTRRHPRLLAATAGIRPDAAAARAMAGSIDRGVLQPPQ